MNREYVIDLGEGGVDQRIDPLFISRSELSDAVNVIVENGMLRTRWGVKYHKTGLKGNVLGVAPYQPHLGQSCATYANGEDSVILSIMGQIWKFNLCTLTGELQSEKHKLNDCVNNHWITTFENNYSASDGVSATIVYDGKEVRLSNGMGDRSSAEIPNRATATVYAHGSLLSAHQRNCIVWGNPINNQNQSEAVDLIKTTLQMSPATYKNLSPPTSIGEIVAMKEIEANMTVHGHNSVVVHGRNGGTYFIDLEKSTRISSYDGAGKLIQRGAKFENYTLIGVKDSAALNPRALDNVSGDQFYRDTEGIQSLKFKLGEDGKFGAAVNPLSEKVRNYIEKDNPDFYDVAAVGIHKKQRRLFASTNLMQRGARGFLSYNLSHLDSDNSIPVWEGLHTLPIGQVQHFFSMRINHIDTFFAVVVDDNQEVYLVEFIKDSMYDILPCGKENPIEWQIVTRKANPGIKAQNKTMGAATVQFRNLETSLKFDLHSRTNSDGCWKMVTQKKIDNTLCCGHTKDVKKAENALPKKDRTARWIQFLLRGCGYMQLESLIVFWDTDGGGETTQDETTTCCDDGKIYDPFSYNKNYKAPC